MKKLKKGGSKDNQRKHLYYRTFKLVHTQKQTNKQTKATNANTRHKTRQNKTRQNKTKIKQNQKKKE